jgi:hypothetical protein
LVQESQGGDLLRAEVDGISHYWNRLPSGAEIDLTREQFGNDPVRMSPVEIRTRDYVLSYADTQRRYELLKKRLAEVLASTWVGQPS